MKKAFLSLITFIILILPLNVKGLTFEEVANKYQEKYDWSVIEETTEYEMYKDFEEQATVIISDNTIKVEYEGDISYYTLFTYEDGIITYNTSLSLEDIEQGNYDFLSIIKSVLDNLAIGKMIYVVGELNGYTVNDLINYASDIEDNKMTLAKNGLEMIEFEYEPKHENEIGIAGVKTFKIDINKLNFEGNQEEPKQDEQQTETKENNQKTTEEEIPQNLLIAYYILAGLIAAIVILSICLVVLTKKNK